MGRSAKAIIVNFGTLKWRLRLMVLNAREHQAQFRISSRFSKRKAIFPAKHMDRLPYNATSGSDRRTAPRASSLDAVVRIDVSYIGGDRLGGRDVCVPGGDVASFHFG